ncbi:hypothetical protein AYO44_15470 [Planctomycetaceae bacterium SCGC AG-212-F19]|nr:hypothetical protein AYO44_15470 [Planctomycetaceae bacterium SCGC AG-212-F19]
MRRASLAGGEIVNETSAAPPPPHEEPGVPQGSGRRWPALLLVGSLAVALGLVYWWGPGEDYYWEWLGHRRGELQQFVADQPIVSRAVFCGAFFAIAACAIPITPAVAMMGGLLFGLWQALLMISFSSTAGASVAFFLSRYLLGDFVERRWGARLEPLRRGVARDGAFYLLALRLSPLVPFSLVNVGMGLTPIRLATFWWVSQLGMLPISFVFVNAGAEAARVQSPRDILSPGMIVAFTLAGLVPVVLRLGWNQVMRRE